MKIEKENDIARKELKNKKKRRQQNQKWKKSIGKY